MPKPITPAYKAYKAALMRLVDEDGMKEALSSVTGSFVGLTLIALEQAGAELKDEEIRIDAGPGSRDITIHAPKEPSHG